MPARDAPLYLDVSEDLRRVDDAMTQLIRDRGQWSEFMSDPNGTLVRLGLHPPTSPEINERANQVFWITLTDRQLMKSVGEHYRDFTPERLDELQRYFMQGLREGVVRHDIDYDLQSLDHLYNDEALLSRILMRGLTLINAAGVLERVYSDVELTEYVNASVEAIRAGLPIHDHPKLEVWDENYGLGQNYGGVALTPEVGAVVTIAVGAEVGAYVTAIVDVGFWGNAREVLTPAAIEGDDDAIRAIATLGRMMDLGGELLAHAQVFRRRQSG